MSQELTDGDGLAGEVHHICQAEHAHDGERGEAHVVERQAKLLEGACDGKAVGALLVEDHVHQRGKERGDEQHRAGVGQQVQIERGARVLASGGKQVACQAGERDLDVGAGEQRGDAQLADGEHDHNDDIGNQGHPCAHGGQLGLGALSDGSHAEALASLVHVLRLHEAQEDNAQAKGNERCDNVGKLVGEVVGAPPLGNSEGSADEQCLSPAVAQALLAVKDDQNQQWNNQGEQRCLVTDDGSYVLSGGKRHRGIATGNHVAGSGDRDSRCAVGNRSGVGDEDRKRSLLRLNTQGQDHRCRDGDGGAEAGKGLKQAAEAEGNQDGLDADVAAANDVEELLQVFGTAGSHRYLVEPHRHDDDEHDGERAVACALQGGKAGQMHRHAEGEDRHQERDDERHERRHMSLGLHTHEHDEECRERDAGHQRRQPKTARNGIDHCLEHKLLSFR